MNTKKQREHQKARRLRKRAERWERDVLTPKYVEAVLTANRPTAPIYIDHVTMKRSPVGVRYKNRHLLLKLLEWEIRAAWASYEYLR